MKKYFLILSIIINTTYSLAMELAQEKPYLDYLDKAVARHAEEIKQPEKQSLYSYLQNFLSFDDQAEEKIPTAAQAQEVLTGVRPQYQSTNPIEVEQLTIEPITEEILSPVEQDIVRLKKEALEGIE